MLPAMRAFGRQKVHRTFCPAERRSGAHPARREAGTDKRINEKAPPDFSGGPPVLLLWMTVT